MNAVNDRRGGGRWGATAPLEAPGINWEVIICVMSLLAIGCVMVFSATSAFAQSPKFNVTETTFLMRHLASIGVAEP